MGDLNLGLAKIKSDAKGCFLDAFTKLLVKVKAPEQNGKFHLFTQFKMIRLFWKEEKYFNHPPFKF